MFDLGSVSVEEYMLFMTPKAKVPIDYTPLPRSFTLLYGGGVGELRFV